MPGQQTADHLDDVVEHRMDPGQRHTRDGRKPVEHRETDRHHAAKLGDANARRENGWLPFRRRSGGELWGCGVTIIGGCGGGGGGGGSGGGGGGGDGNSIAPAKPVSDISIADTRRGRTQRVFIEGFFVFKRPSLASWVCGCGWGGGRWGGGG